MGKIHKTEVGNRKGAKRKKKMCDKSQVGFNYTLIPHVIILQLIATLSKALPWTMD